MSTDNVGVTIHHHATTPHCDGKHSIATTGAYCHSTQYWTVVAADVDGEVLNDQIGKRTREEEWRFIVRGEADRWATELNVASATHIADGPHRCNGWVVRTKTEVAP